MATLTDSAWIRGYWWSSTDVPRPPRSPNAPASRRRPARPVVQSLSSAPDGGAGARQRRRWARHPIAGICQPAVEPVAQRRCLQVNEVGSNDNLHASPSRDCGNPAGRGYLALAIYRVHRYAGNGFEEFRLVEGGRSAVHIEVVEGHRGSSQCEFPNVQCGFLYWRFLLPRHRAAQQIAWHEPGRDEDRLAVDQQDHRAGA